MFGRVCCSNRGYAGGCNHDHSRNDLVCIPNLEDQRTVILKTMASILTRKERAYRSVTRAKNIKMSQTGIISFVEPVFVTSSANRPPGGSG